MKNFIKTIATFKREEFVQTLIVSAATSSGAIVILLTLLVLAATGREVPVDLYFTALGIFVGGYIVAHIIVKFVESDEI